MALDPLPAAGCSQWTGTSCCSGPPGEGRVHRVSAAGTRLAQKADRPGSARPVEFLSPSWAMVPQPHGWGVDVILGQDGAAPRLPLTVPPPPSPILMLLPHGLRGARDRWV